MKYFVGIMGATAVGKSAIAVQLAKQINGEIISADSMQVYRGMNIGTGKISAEQMEGVPHHMLDIVDIDSNFTAYDYVQLATDIIEDITARGKVPIVVGGTGLYFYGLAYGFQHVNSCDDNLRAELNNLLETQGLDALVKYLQQIDAKALDVIDICNAKRVVRAIEIAKSGSSVTVNSNNRPKISPCDLYVINKNRATLYDDIDIRVDSMVKQGLIEEVINICQQYYVSNLQSLQAIGYKEIIDCLNSNGNISEAVDLIKLHSRRYAKRQLCYYKRMQCQWIDADDMSMDSIVDTIVRSTNIKQI